MLPKWKLILTNWINCYFNSTNLKDLPVNLESLIDIISHLRENLNLDETKSSLLDAYTVQEFIVEKYPNFKFKNGSIEPDDEEDIYLVASLLLFFVCVNSKNVDMKSAMCSKLSPGDQETILKFSKHLMECTNINIMDVRTAITEACGQEVAVEPISTQTSVAETPPVLRSYHSEVRRLQAALDAETFDRTFLQEELSRTNMKVEKLLKDKEQYKLEIVNLKSQISLCCGQERESQGEDTECSNISKLTRQLEETEERLMSAQEELEDVQKERETYKRKLSEIKLEHEKLLVFSHQESTRANGLAEELEVERRHTQSLRELVDELRQHNHLNKIDSSLLECDDPDASINSLPHNSSTCSEMCANVIEVQLGEERAKTEALKQQLQMLQVQLSEMTKINEEQKLSLTQIIWENKNTIMTLRCRVNEEIEEKSILKTQFDDEVAKLNNELIELEQRLKESQENSRNVFESKMKEIQNLQEEKLSLLQSLSEEMNKSENNIKHLKDELDVEKVAKTRQKDEYDSMIMELNKKMLNRNNELVELQNKILEKGEMIETLQLELRREKELREEISNKHNEELAHLSSVREQIERECRAKDVECNDISETMRQLEQQLQSAQKLLLDVQEERETYKTKLSYAKSEQEKLLALYHQESARARGLTEELEVERANVVTFKQQIQMLQDELVEYKIKIENEKEEHIIEQEQLKQMISEKENTIMTLKRRLDEEIHDKNISIKHFDDKIAKLNDELIELEQRLKETQENSKNIIENKIEEIQNLQEGKLSLLQSLSEEINKSENIIKHLKDELDVEKAAKIRQKDEYDSIIMELNKKMLNKNNELVEMQNKKLEEGDIIETLQLELRREKELREEMSNKHNEELVHLSSIREQIERECRAKDVECNDISETMRQLEQQLQSAQKLLLDVQKERETYKTKLSYAKSEHEKLLALYHQESARARGVTEELEVERANVATLKQQIQILQVENWEYTRKIEKEKEEHRIEKEQLNQIISTKDNTIMTLKHRLDEITEEKNITKKHFDDKFAMLNNELIELEQRFKGTQENSKNIIENNMKEIQNLQEDKLSLLQSLSEEMSKSENIIKHLKDEVDAEKGDKIRQRDEYDYMIMELNEKMLNRNKELVELQNKILEKGDIIETLQLELRREKELREEMSNKHNEELAHLSSVREQIERECRQKDVECNDISETMRQLEQQLQSAQKLLVDVQRERETSVTKLTLVNTEHEKLLALSHQESARARGLTEELEVERANVVTLKQQIQMLQDQNSVHTRKIEEEKEEQRNEIEQLKQMVAEKENTKNTLQHRLDEEIHEKNISTKHFDDKIAKLNDELIELQQRLKGTQENSRHIIENKMKEIQNLQEEKLSLLQSLSEETRKSDNTSKYFKDEIDAEKADKIRQRDEYDSIIMKLNEKMLNRNNELVELQNKILEKGDIIETLQLELRREKELREEMSNKHNEELAHLSSVREQIERECRAKDVECNDISETMRQLEQQLQSAQKQLVDVQRERETYKTKLSQMKSEHEKSLAVSHQESVRASGLAEELEVERRQTQSLRELVEELRQHNHINKMDSSFLACEDADASINSLPHYKSACSEVGANVLEVQLEEERAKTEALKQQIQMLQDQLSDNTTKTEKEKENQRIEKDILENTIMTLKHRVNEEIEEKNALTKKFDDEVAKLSSDFIELEHRLKGTQENSRNIIENKVKEIQSLQEEKLSLLQNLSDETSKSENVIKHLQEEIDAEKSSKIRQRDEYDSHAMKLNEKMLNRNNELVELQNKILDKGETIETLQLELRREKELREEISNKHNEELIRLNSVREQLEQDLQRKTDEAEDLHKHLQQHIALLEQINEDNELLKANIVQLEADYKILKDSEEKLLSEVKNRDVEAEQIYKETENLKNLLFEEKQKLQNQTEKTRIVNALQNEIQPASEHAGRQLSNALVTPPLLQTCLDAAIQEKSSYKNVCQGIDVRDQCQQVDTTPTQHSTSSFECCKTITDLEKILQDRNRTIRSLQSDITDLKSFVAESENKLLDVSNELEVSKENCQQLSNQLKKIVHQKNEEIAELKKQLTKMSMTENRASQIIKVSAKYQAIILKRIAEIKSNTVLKELTNFGNTTNCDNDLRRGLNAKTITMEDLENFLDTTDRHLKRFSEKQLALQKERDRLVEVNKINESEIISVRKFLTELSVSIKTFNSVKEMYAQKLSRVVSLQRTVRREILGLDGQITDATMCKLERGYAAVMQDLSECALNLERWVERTIGRVVSVEKIKQAFSSEERASVATTTVQNASLEVQLEELENSFCKLLEEIARAQKGEEAKVAQAVTVMEVRAEYEDKLNRMKAKMKELYQEQIGIFKEKQREEIVSLERELQRTREKLEESSRAYEEHIRSLTTELWNVGEKFLMKKDEAEWLRRKQRSGSLMSLQHVHSAGLMPTQEEPGRPSDTHSLRSLPVTSNANGKSEGRALQMSDEEGEVFDNRCLRELAATPARARGEPPARRLSELQWRNSLCPPHLKSSYPAETQFVSAIHEEDIKCVGPTMSLGGRSQRKEVGITAYKKPGPPTPSKQAGRLSATDSELRESLRVESEPNASRKTSTPSRIRALFRSGKGDNEGTPRSRRLSNMFRKK